MIIASILVFGLILSSATRIPRLPEDIVHVNTTNEKITMLFQTVPHIELMVLELVINSFLFLDIVLRFSVSMRKLVFMRCPLNIIELLSVLASYFIIQAEMNPKLFNSIFNFSASSYSTPIASFFFGIRVIRILRLAHHANEMKILCMCIKSSRSEMLFLVILFVSCSLLFGTCIYSAEFMTPGIFETFFISVWWAVITMTTIGYGDIVPKSILGYIVGTFTAVVGIIIMAMPIAVLSSKFSTYYKSYRIAEKVNKEKKALKPQKMYIEDISEHEDFR